MSEYNKLLWFLFIVGLNGIISITIRKVKSERILSILGMLFVLIVLLVSICWVYFDFWK